MAGLSVPTVLRLALTPPSLITAQSKEILEGMLSRGFTSVRDAAGAFLGSMADITGRRKPYILIFQILTAIGCAILWFATPGSAAIGRLPAVSSVLS